MKIIEHFVDGKIVPGSSKKKGKVFNPATGEQSAEVKDCIETKNRVSQFLWGGQVAQFP